MQSFSNCRVHQDYFEDLLDHILLGTIPMVTQRGWVGA